MEAFVFSSDEALQVALRSGLVPYATQQAPVQVGVTAAGEWEMVPQVAMARQAQRALESAGVARRRATAAPRLATCWAEALPLRAAGLPQGSLGEVLFAASSQRSLLDLAGELLRLGCDRQQLATLEAGPVKGLLRAVEPPWFAVTRAQDRASGVRAFVPTDSRDARIWVELGHRHPLQDHLLAPDHGLLLLPSHESWWRCAPSQWFEVDALLVPVGMIPAVSILEATAPFKVAVPLVLKRAAKPAPATFFVVPRGRTVVEALVRATPEAQLEGLDFAASADDVFLRLRPGHSRGDDAWPGEAYATLSEIPGLYAPAGLTLEPPLRRDRLRAWLAPDPEVLTWLQPSGAGIQAHHISEAAFRPLNEWVDYVIDTSAAPLSVWVKSATFDFEPYVVATDPPSAPSSVVAQEPMAVPPASAPRPGRGGSLRNLPRDAREAPRLTPPLPVAAASVARSSDDAEALVGAAERAFLDADALAGSQSRRALWVQLALAYAKAARHRDAGVAWAHALWEADAAEGARLARRWAESTSIRLEKLVAGETSSADELHAVVAQLVQGASEADSPLRARVAERSGWLERHGNELDVRSYWLAREAVARLAGGDVLGQARARDRVLVRIQSGLSLERDVPRFLRLSAQGAGNSGVAGAPLVVAQLESLLHAFLNTPRKRSAIEAPFHLTQAYLQLIFGWGFARLGDGERARALRESAAELINDPDSVHRYLQSAFGARLSQALEGLSPSTPLPPEVNGLIVGLENFDRYKVDRLRQFSQILEPQERLEAISALFGKSGAMGRGEELAALRALGDPAELLKGIRARMGAAADHKLNLDERVRLIDGLLDFLPGLPESQALPLLQEFLALGDKLAGEHRVLVLEDALKVAGHFGKTALVKQLVAQLGTAIKEVGASGAENIGRLLVAGVRMLRRVGLKDEASELLARAASVLQGDDLRTLNARLGLAAGFMYLGSREQAQPILDQALARLGRESGLIIAERLKLTRATAAALSYANTEVALSGLSRIALQIQWVTDSFNTNTHYCLSVLSFADALVLGHVGDDLTLNALARRFLDEDEYLVRRRLHRDVGERA